MLTELSFANTGAHVENTFTFTWLISILVCVHIMQSQAGSDGFEQFNEEGFPVHQATIARRFGILDERMREPCNYKLQKHIISVLKALVKKWCARNYNS